MKKTCSVQNCDRETEAKGFCNRHYQSYLKYGDPTRAKRKPKNDGICTVPGCDARSRTPNSAWCEKHYIRNYRHGSPNVVNEKIYDLDYSSFDRLTSEIVWILGLIWSDGCLQGNTISITSKDIVLLETVENLLNGINLIVERCNPRRHYVLRFNSAHIAHLLRNIGLTESKSLTIGWPKIEDNWSFIRGILDGDGCVYVSKKRNNQRKLDATVMWYTASESLASHLISFLRLEGFHPSMSTSKKKATLYRIAVHRIADVREIYWRLYPKNCPSLERKKRLLSLWMIDREYLNGSSSISSPVPKKPSNKANRSRSL